MTRCKKKEQQLQHELDMDWHNTSHMSNTEAASGGNIYMNGWILTLQFEDHGNKQIFEAFGTALIPLQLSHSFKHLMNYVVVVVV